MATKKRKTSLKLTPIFIAIGLLLIVVVLTIYTFVSWQNGQTIINTPQIENEVSAVDVLNQHSYLPYPFLVVYDSLDKNKLAKDYTYINNFASDDYYNAPDPRDANIALYFSGYPTEKDPYVLTRIILQIDTYHVYTVKVGTQIGEALQVFSEYGFAKQATSDASLYDLINDNIRLGLFVDEAGLISEIILEVKS